jgi:hypothetical protein
MECAQCGSMVAWGVCECVRALVSVTVSGGEKD